MSHATHDWVREIVPRIRESPRNSARGDGNPLDTQGPAIRTGESENSTQCTGESLNSPSGDRGARKRIPVGVNYDGLINDISVGDTVLVDNGVMHLQVLAKKSNRIRLRRFSQRGRSARAATSICPGSKSTSLRSRKRTWTMSRSAWRSAWTSSR